MLLKKKGTREGVIDCRLCVCGLDPAGIQPDRFKKGGKSIDQEKGRGAKR